MPNDPFLYVSHSGNQPLPSSSAAVEVSSFPNVASHPRSQTPPASSATTPHYLNERAALTDEEYFRMIDDCLAAAHVDLLDQVYDLQSISEPALLWDLPVAGGARTVSPQFLAVNPSACWRVPPSEQDNPDNHSLSQPGVSDGNQHQYGLQTQDPGGEAGFTEELVRLFSVRSHAERGSEGDIPCLMCRRKFTKACQSLRHMEQCHILHKIWVCKMGGCAGIKTEAPKHRLLSPDSHGNVFHRKDNFTSHLVARHGVADSEARNSIAESVEFVRCPLPTELRCSVAGCKIGYEGGDNVLDKLLKHITKDHATDLDHSYTWRNAILPYLLSRNIVVRGPAGLRPAAHDDVSFLAAALPFLYPSCERRANVMLTSPFRCLPSTGRQLQHHPTYRRAS